MPSQSRTVARAAAALARVPRHRPIGLVAAFAAGVVLTACSSTPVAARRPSTSAPRPRHGHGRTTTTSPSTTSSAPSTTGPGTTTTAPPGALTTCASGVLSLHEAGVAAAAGTSHLTFDLTNQGPRSCTMEGYPSVAFFGGSGAGGAGAGSKLPVRDIDLGSPPGRVTLPSGTGASFVLSVAEVPVNGIGCKRVAAVQVVPPGGDAAISVPAAFQACGGTVGVYPVTGGS